jgi:hypothetical protein
VKEKQKKKEKKQTLENRIIGGAFSVLCTWAFYQVKIVKTMDGLLKLAVSI